MSNPFESRLAEQLVNYFEETSPRGGQVLSATFRQRNTATRFATSIVDHDAVQWRKFKTSRETRSLPAIVLNDSVPIFVVRVVPEEEEAGLKLEDYYVTQSGATTMRDIVADSADTPEEKAVLMIYEDSVSLDTLSASADILEDGPLELEAFRQDVLKPSQSHDEAETAFLRGLRRVVNEAFSNNEDTETLNQLCKIRNAVDNGTIDQIPELIGTLPGFIQEDYFRPDLFHGYESSSEVVKVLERNINHHRRIHIAQQPGRQFRSELSNYYKQDFIDKIEDVVDISTMTHTEAKKGELQTSKREFIEVDVIAEKSEHFGAPETPYSNANLRQSVIAVANDGEVRVRARFRGDMEDVPYCLRYSDESKDEDSISKREGTLTATIEPPHPDQIHFVNFQIYVGNKGTSGYPSHEFSVAIVPSELYEILAPLQLDVNVPDETFVSHGDGSLTIEGPTTSASVETDVQDDDVVELIGTLELHPKIPDQTPYIDCTVQTDIVNFDLQFQTGVSTAEREEIPFPLQLAAIADPDEWSATDLELPDHLTVDLDLEEIQLGSKSGVGIEEDTLPLLQIEKQYIKEATPVRRQSESDSLNFGSPIDEQIPAEVQAAYDELFEHFDDRNRTPSTDPWDNQTRERVRKVLDAYIEASQDNEQSFDAFKPIQGIGRIESASTEKVWLTPYHPVMLAYGLRLAQWRESLIDDDATDGFRSEEATQYLNPVGYLPYLYSDKEVLLRGTRSDQNALWATYSPPEDVGTETPAFVDRVLSHQGTAFINAFRILFELHPSRELIINTVNLGDLKPLVEGIFKIFGRLKSRNIDYPEILIRIYGTSTEGEALQQFLMDDAESSLRDRLQRYDDERVEAMRANIKYVHKGSYNSESIDRAHLTLFQGILDETPGDHNIGALDDSLYMDGLLPRESILNSGEGEDTTYITGFGSDTDNGDQIVKTTWTANSLEAAKKSDGAPEGRSLKRSVKASRSGLDSIWDVSQWAVHIRPGVGLEFYTRSGKGSEGDDTVMIQHSDQYDSSSPGYDVVTSTRQRRPYVNSLEKILTEHGISDSLDAQDALSYLVAIDGQLISDIQRNDPTSTAEAMGIVGAIAIEQYYLSQAYPNYAWFPTSIDELVGHDISLRTDQPGLISYDPDDAACDDLCFVGLPINGEDADTVKLWLVEAKGSTGSSDPSQKGVEQVRNGVDALKQNFSPDGQPADVPLIHAVFGNFVVTAMERLNSYSVFTDRRSVVKAWKSRLLNGDFGVEFLTSDQGTIGDVVVVGASQTSDISYEEDVRVVNLPSSTAKLLQNLEMLAEEDVADNLVSEVIPDLDLNELLEG